jgi:RHS repeat-associated protein
VSEKLFAGEQFDSTLDQYYLRARYYDQSQGRFTQQDTWMGRNHDPVTLHKYLYTHSDPVNGIDPSGKAGLFGFSVAQNINAILITTSVVTTGFELYSYGTGAKEVTAKNLGFTTLALLSGPLAGKLIRGVSAARAAKIIENALLSGNVGKLLLRSGKTNASVLRRFIPSGAKNTFKPSGTIKSGFKYQFKVGNTKVEFKWHSPDLNAKKLYPGSNSGNMWTAQIKIKNKFLGSDGNFYRNNKTDLTHIPIDIF